MVIDPLDSGQYRASLFNSVVAPRPIGWISTVDAEGVPNLAPFSYFNGMSATPPMVMFACNAPDDRPEKDTLANARATGEFAANLATWELRHAMNRSSATVPHGVDEFELAGVTRLPSRIIRAPQVAQSPVSMECKVLRIFDFEPEHPGDRRSSVVFGRVLSIRVDDAYLDANGRFDVLRASPIARLGGFNYLAVRELFELARPGKG
jgi:flavin reductase (DIM6/NTAB) family NADH-FMN oxidoreductase RutF